jgi:hypothetical protein
MSLSSLLIAAGGASLDQEGKVEMTKLSRRGRDSFGAKAKIDESAY